MEYQVFGRTGLRVSPVALGTGLWAGRNTVAECLAMMDRAIDVGVNFIDTSNVYSAGASEEAIGEGLKGRRDSVVLATKVRTKVSDDHPNDGGLSRTHIMSQVERSLTRLKTDYIDIYQMHHPDKNTPIEVSLRAFDDLISQGKVRYVGTSNFTAPLLVETLWRSEVGGFDAPISDQTGYSLIRRQVETDVLPWCRRYGLAFLAYSPLARGTLTGRYHIGDPPEIGSRVERLGFHKTDWWDGTLEVVETLRGHVLEKSCSLTQFAVAWLMRQPSVTPIIGPRTMEQLDDNLGALDVEITDEDLAFVDQISPS